ncbi:MAG: alkaline phosphatase D family protein, partial [Phycisphaerales bacterium]
MHRLSAPRLPAPPTVVLALASTAAARLLGADAQPRLAPRAGKILIDGLAPAQRHFVRVTDGDLVRVATFRTDTAPLGTAIGDTGARFGVTGDWRGDVGIYNAILNADERELDFFVKLGDTIYADVASPAVPAPQATTLAEFRAKHVENYAPTHGIDPWGDLAASTPTFSMIDDHEVTNDFDGGAARSFRDASLPPVPDPFAPAEVQQFLLASFDPSRTMLGLPQLGLLLDDLVRAEQAGVTWKFIMTSMPMQNFGPLAAEDRWEGYAAERAILLSQIVALGIRNVVFV